MVIIRPPGSGIAILYIRDRQRIPDFSSIVAHAVRRDAVVLGNIVVKGKMECFMISGVAGAATRSNKLADCTVNLSGQPVKAQWEIRTVQDLDRGSPITGDRIMRLVDFRVFQVND